MQVGDIIFQSQNEESEFSKAITHSSSLPSSNDIINQISHVGLYIGNDLVIEATQKHGVIKQPLKSFLGSAQYNVVATISDNVVIKNALIRVQDCLGLPYNHSFRSDAKGFYCSQLITYAFKYESGKNYFKLYPMNFKNLTTAQILP